LGYYGHDLLTITNVDGDFGTTPPAIDAGRTPFELVAALISIA